MSELTIIGALRNAATGQKALSLIPQHYSGWWRTIHEPWTGAWQHNKEEEHGTVLCYPTLYACISRLNQDVGKLPFVLKREDGKGIWHVVENPAYSPVLRKPNHYQTAQQFREAWILSKLIHGNAYILKRRDNRDVVTHLYVLDPCRVMPMVSDSGDVFYQINYPTASNLLPDSYPAEQLTIPAREIIHDRMNAFHHQLIGVPPVCAAHWPAVKNLKILKTSTDFFANGTRPGGILMAPAGTSQEDGQKIKEFWQENYTGVNSGKVAFVGADLKYQALSMTTGADSQLVEQMRYSDEQICQPFGIKPYKIGIGQVPGGWKSDDVNVEYFGDALSPLVEAMENLLDEGMGIARPLGVELDSSPLWRMDEGKQAEVESKLVGGKIKTPDEARQRLNLSPTGGGDTIWGQHQDYPLGMLAERNDLNPAPITPPTTEPDPAIESANEEVRRLSAELWQRKALEATREAIQ